MAISIPNINTSGGSVPYTTDIPLNHLIWLNEYKTYGQNSYVYNDNDIWKELLQSKAAINDMSMIELCAKYFKTSESNIQNLFSNIYGVVSSDFDDIHTLDELNACAGTILSSYIDNTFVLAYIGNLCTPVSATSYNGTCYIVDVTNSGRSYSNTSNVSAYRQYVYTYAKSGAKYTLEDGTVVTAISSVSDGNSGTFTKETVKIGKIASSFSSISATSRYVETNTYAGSTVTSSTTTYNSTFIYFPIAES